MNYNDMFILEELHGAYTHPPVKGAVLHEAGLSPRSGHPVHKLFEKAFSQKDKGNQVVDPKLEIDFDSDD
ncbi:hypothetical protein PVK06_020217 [Gossypium arboreum]|uniref:Uncharacterized protein n=1 Tax=Gossypium arboreum TaxID=29729 RepID=A0ABR0PM46_GOSAR|nr:hypothetical protein PVK06_020217 [Gossypium arboreum]